MRAEGAATVVLYAEVPGFYAEVERRADPALAGRPLLVGGDPAKRGKVQSASPEALATGVLLGMPMLEALRVCPEASRRPCDMKRYRDAASALAICLRRVVDELEPAGLGAAYADVHGRREAPEQLAESLCRLVQSELGLPLRVGVAPSKLLARLAAEEAGSSGVRRIHAGEVGAFLAPLGLTRLPRVGRKTAAAIEALGASTVGELGSLDPELLERELGNHGLTILELARGEDRSPVRVARHPASISREQSIPAPGRAELPHAVRRLARALELALARQGLRARRVALKLRLDDQTTTTRSSTLGEPVVSATEIYSAADALLSRCPVAPARVRSLGITLAGLAVEGDEEEQLDLFPS